MPSTTPSATFSADTTTRRMDAQLLSTRSARAPGEVVERLLAVQAQELRGFRLAVRARSTELGVADVDRALEDGTLVVGWLNRGTLHLVRREDYWDLFALTTPQLLTTSRRRLAQEGVSPEHVERGVAVVREALTAGPRTRAELKLLLEDANVPVAGQALVHVLYAASLRGLLLRGPMRDGEQAFIAAADQVGPRPDLDVGEAAVRLARRYLAGHGPASAHDLARWAGLPLGRARAAYAALADEVQHLDDGLMGLAGRPEPAPLPGPRLLGQFDPLLHGWADRTPVTGAHADVVTSNGIFRPTLLVGGRVVGTWSMASGTLVVQCREPLSAHVLRAVEQDAADVHRYLESPGRTTIRRVDDGGG